MRNWNIWAVAALSLAITLPMAAPALASPLGAQASTDSALALELLAKNGVVDPELTVVTVPELTLPGGKNIVGYVNMFDLDDVIYVRPFTDGFPFRSNTKTFGRVLLHEYSHIVQKRLVEESTSAAGYVRTAKLMELDRLLGADVSNVDEHAGLSGFAGLEVSADCIAAATSTSYAAHYLRKGVPCTLEQTAAAHAVLAGQWPTAETVTVWTGRVRAAYDRSLEQVAATAAARAELAVKASTVTNRAEYCAVVSETVGGSC